MLWGATHFPEFLNMQFERCLQKLNSLPDRKGLAEGLVGLLLFASQIQDLCFANQKFAELRGFSICENSVSASLI